jgi:hypothetical protein
MTFRFFGQHGRLPLSGRIRVDAIEISNLRRVGLVAGSALIFEINGFGDRRLRHYGARSSCSGNGKPKQIAPGDNRLEALLHKGRTPKSSCGHIDPTALLRSSFRGDKLLLLMQLFQSPYSRMVLQFRVGIRVPMEAPQHPAFSNLFLRKFGVFQIRTLLFGKTVKLTAHCWIRNQRSWFVSRRDHAAYASSTRIRFSVHSLHAYAALCDKNAKLQLLLDLAIKLSQNETANMLLGGLIAEYSPKRQSPVAANSHHADRDNHRCAARQQRRRGSENVRGLAVRYLREESRSGLRFFLTVRKPLGSRTGSDRPNTAFENNCLMWPTSMVHVAFQGNIRAVQCAGRSIGLVSS